MRTILLAFFLLCTPLHAQDLLPEPKLGDNGMHVQPWFHEGFLELSDDLDEASGSGKDLLILFEQAGCPYCREMHKVNLRIPDIVDTVRSKFMVVQLDLRGSREVTDFDGEALEERDLARKWGVIFTPTLVFIPAEAADMEGDGKARAAVMMPGYFKPFHFETMLHFVADDAYRNGGDFQRYLNERADKLRAEGKDVTIWSPHRARRYSPALEQSPFVLPRRGVLKISAHWLDGHLARLRQNGSPHMEQGAAIRGALFDVQTG